MFILNKSLNWNLLCAKGAKSNKERSSFFSHSTKKVSREIARKNQET